MRYTVGGDDHKGRFIISNGELIALYAFVIVLGAFVIVPGYTVINSR
jgi:hypothetical protein